MIDERPEPVVHEKTMTFTFKLLIKPRLILSVVIALYLVSECLIFEAPPQAATQQPDDLEYRITPLIHSTSVTVFNQTETPSNRIWFKPSSSPNWQKALALQWEPITSALSGSIVRLKPDTLYDVKIKLFDNNGLLDEILLQFKTRPNKPPVDPEKIYYLSDIYSGGQLDLEALGIEGNEKGWAKIIGDSTEVIAGESDISAINMGSQNYVVLENIVVKGGVRYGIYGYKSHHIWIDGATFPGGEGRLETCAMASDIKVKKAPAL